ncbi:GNAT family N-acetyltransferase [Maribellus maritimus]|uniref:GNAT family N-acetyltransferase n=1 Tax=Maribellus maritimus TaxID=2870838 RepID=UPI001EEBE0C2|nr:GNAT family N-acetyltransferase [Maribellus maritimus]MCG6186540.1 GNAT family N-acetyltransferase [Maribellus maritimus]
MQVIPVTDKQTVDEFHKLPETIYKNDSNWVPQLRLMLEDSFDPKKNAKFKTGDARRWILKKDGKYIGRIAAFYDDDYAGGYEQPIGGCGFFECIEDKSAAFLLFDTAKIWLKENGMEAMDGPINFGENFFYWGLLSDGFKSQTFGMQYNPPYYQHFFEAYGFKTFYDQYSYSLDITNPDLPDRFWKIAAWVAQKPGFSYQHFRFKNRDKYIRDFIEIHKQAWSHHGNYKPVRFEQLKEMLDSSKLLLDEEFIWFVYHNNSPIAFYMMIPDFNQILQKFSNGKFNLYKIIKFFYYKKMKAITRCRVIVLGVIPKYQRMGIESGIFYQLKKVMLRKTWYNDMEMSWVGDFNPKMNALFKSFGARQTLTHKTMRYLFNQNKTFKRAPIID